MNTKRTTAQLLIVVGLAFSTAVFAAGGGTSPNTQSKRPSTVQMSVLPAEVVPPVTVSARASGPVHWILPGPRKLDPEVFGTPDKPLGWQDAIGVPIAQRLKNEAGTAWTRTSVPTPHSDLSRDVQGTASFAVSDVTAVDGDSTRDKINFVAEFSGPDENGQHDRYQVVVNKAIPHGPNHPFFGGVETNAYLHGSTGIGTMLQPRQFAYAAFWGVGKLYRNGKLVADNQVVHVMITQRVRTSLQDGYKLVFTDQVASLGGMGKQMHVILAPTEVTSKGVMPRPVPTGFKLPNGKTQPFLHIMYDTVTDVQGGLAGK